MANVNVPSGVSLDRLDGTTANISWSVGIRSGYRYNIYAAIEGTATPLPGPALVAGLHQQVGAISLVLVAGNSPPSNNILVTVTSVSDATSEESAQSATLLINAHSGEVVSSPSRVMAGRAPNGDPTFLATDMDGELTITTSSTLPPNAAVETKQDDQIAELQTLVTQTADVATETTVATLGTEATLAAADTKLGTLVTQTADVATETTVATLATEATAATLGTEATLATRASEATLAAADTKLGTLVTQTSDVATETTLATLATEATAATLGTEATLATLATEATVATLGTEVTLAAADTKLGTLVTQTADVATETTQATLATEATAATLGTEATLATLGTQATLATRASETTLSAADTKLGTIAGDTTSLDGKLPAQGQAAMTASLPVVVASDQSPVDVEDLLTGANAPTAIPVGATNVALPTTPLVGRKLVVLYNAGNTPVLLGIGGTNVFPLAAGQPLSVSASNAVAFTGQRPTGSGNVIVWEFS